MLEGPEQGAAACRRTLLTKIARLLQVYYARTQEQQNLFPTNTTLKLATSFVYTYDQYGYPVAAELPLADACSVRRSIKNPGTV